jgi:SnoaL-like domain
MTEEERIRIAADRSDIINLLGTYHQAIDMQTWELFDEIMLTDAEASWEGLVAVNGESSPRGRSAIIDWLKGALGDRRSLHYMVNHVIRPTGDTATGTSYVGVAADASGTIHHLGYYNGEYVRTAAGWRIKRLTFVTSEYAGAVTSAQTSET